MTLAIIELNDAGLLGTTTSQDNKHLVTSPGYAMLGKDQVITGNKAAQQAYLHPQQSFHQFWRQLNLSPLAFKHKLARHNADLAYAHLKAVHEELDKPEQLVFAVPGSMSNEQLAILLGLAKALPFETVGLVDSAVAAVSAIQDTASNIENTDSQQWLHVDMHINHTVLTSLSVGEGIVKREAVDVLPGVGQKTFVDQWAHFVADQFIHHYRYDPLHTATGEQQLYDQLPQWLEALNSNSEIPVELDSPQGGYRIRLNRNQLLADSADKIENLSEKIRQIIRPEQQLLLSGRVDKLLGIADHLGNITVCHSLHEQAALDGCMEHSAQFVSQSSDAELSSDSNAKNNPENNAKNSHDAALHLITALAQTDSSYSDSTVEHSEGDTTDIVQEPTAIVDATSIEKANIPIEQKPANSDNPDNPAKNDPARVATHLLYGHQAYAIADTLSLHIADNMASNDNENDRESHAVVTVADNGNLVLTRHNNALSVRTDLSNMTINGNPNKLMAGNSFVINGHSFLLIEVC